MLVFVAGATGYTGREVVREARASGLRTVAHIRPDSAQRARFTTIFENLDATVDVTPWEEVSVTRTLRELRPGVVFALLGTTRARERAAARSGEKPMTYSEVDYGLTALLLRAAVGCGSRPRFVYLSAAGAGGVSQNAYYAARNSAERDIRESGLPYVIARPSFITGSDRDEARPLERASAALADTLLSAAGALGAQKLRDRYRSVTGSDLARALVRYALDPSQTEAVVPAEALRG